MKLQLRCTKQGLKSSSLKRLAEALSAEVGYKVFRTTKVFPKRKQFVYGASVNKLQQYQWFKEQGLSALEFTTNEQEALQWQKQGFYVFGRKLLNSSCGKGIILFLPFNEEGLEPNGQAHGCPVYTLYRKKKREFRVHVFKDKVVAIVEKKLRKAWDKGPSKVRNLANGYVFVHEFELSDSLRERIVSLALSAAPVSTSDFKGVDLAYNEKHDDLFVIEVNSAPGIEGSNVNAYVKAICNV